MCFFVLDVAEPRRVELAIEGFEEVRSDAGVAAALGGHANLGERSGVALLPDQREGRGEPLDGHPAVPIGDHAGEVHGDRGVMRPGAYFWRPPFVRHGPYGTQTLGDLDEQALVLPVDDRGHQLVAARELPVDRGAADLGPSRDVVECDTAESVSFELLDRGVEDDPGNGVGRCQTYGVTPSLA